MNIGSGRFPRRQSLFPPVINEQWRVAGLAVRRQGFGLPGDTGGGEYGYRDEIDVVEC